VRGSATTSTSKKAATPKPPVKKAATPKPPVKKAATPKPPVKKAAVKRTVAPKSTEPGGVFSPEARRPPNAFHPLLSSDQWDDKNRALFAELQEIAAEIEVNEKVPVTERSALQRQRILRLQARHKDVVYKIYYENYGLAHKYVRRFTKNASREDIDDFEAAATVGLIRAITTYDPARGRFAQWAFKPMQREVLRAVHSADHPNMNSGDFERRPDILRAMHHLQNGDESVHPTMEAIAKEAGVTVEQAKRVLQAPRLESIYKPVGDGTATLGDMIVDESDNLEDNVITRMGIKDLQNYGLSELDPRELFVISRRQGLDCEPKQRLNSIGAHLNLSREAVRQIEGRARGKLAHPILLRKLLRDGRS
jgi:RNA polymerase primary sigma factor/RNA polymerase nonessential primary-like sigma factor